MSKYIAAHCSGSSHPEDCLRQAVSGAPAPPIPVLGPRNPAKPGIFEPWCRPLCAGFTLVEVALALGLISFAIVAIMGLLPMLLDSLRVSGERATTTRVYQSVAEDVFSQPPTVNDNRIYTFDREGMLLSIEPSRPGLFNRQGEVHYQASTSTSNDDLGGSDSQLVHHTITISNSITGALHLRRAVWTVDHE